MSWRRWSIVTARAQEMADGYGVTLVLTDAAELDSDQIDAAIVATPPFHHAPCSIDLMKRGIHVLVEKPMATTYQDAVDMVRTAEQQGVVLSVGFFRRLNPSIRMMKAMLDSQWLGKPVSFHVEGGGMYNWPAATLANMRKDWAGGGVLIDFGSHMLDLMFSLFDEPADVIECQDNSHGGVESDCTIELRVRHQDQPVEGVVELARTRDFGRTDPSRVRARNDRIPGQRSIPDPHHSIRFDADRFIHWSAARLLARCRLGRRIRRDGMV